MAVPNAELDTPRAGLNGRSALRRVSVALVSTVWLSTALFGVYILIYYAGAVADRQLGDWNAVLPRLYERSAPAATASIGLHFAAGGVILMLGCIQLSRRLRDRHPAVHRGLGRVYLAASFLAGIGGLGFILIKGTVGGPVMSVGFAGYGIALIFCAVQAYRNARARRIEIHEAWALRLFALAIGSWLYRMYYGFWFLLTDRLAHTEDFHGGFDRVMAYFFWVPNLIVVELYLRARRRSSSAITRWAAVALLAVATGFVVLATYFFAVEFWFPAMAERFAA